MTLFLLTVVVFTILWLFWQILNWVFDLIDQHASADRRSREAASPRKGKVT